MHLIKICLISYVSGAKRILLFYILREKYLQNDVSNASRMKQYYFNNFLYYDTITMLENLRIDRSDIYLILIEAKANVDRSMGQQKKASHSWRLLLFG